MTTQGTGPAVPTGRYSTPTHRLAPDSKPTRSVMYRCMRATLAIDRRRRRRVVCFLSTIRFGCRICHHRRRPTSSVRGPNPCHADGSAPRAPMPHSPATPAITPSHDPFPQQRIASRPPRGRRSPTSLPLPSTQMSTRSPTLVGGPPRLADVLDAVDMPSYGHCDEHAVGPIVAVVSPVTVAVTRCRFAPPRHTAEHGSHGTRYRSLRRPA